MIYIVGNPRLQEAGRSAVNDATTINERSVEATDLRDVGVRGNDITIRQYEAQFRAGMSFEMDFEFGYFHGLMGLSISVAQQSRGRTKQTVGTARSAPSSGATR